MTEALREEEREWKSCGGEGLAEDVDVGVRQREVPG